MFTFFDHFIKLIQSKIDLKFKISITLIFLSKFLLYFTPKMNNFSV